MHLKVLALRKNLKGEETRKKSRNKIKLSQSLNLSDASKANESSNKANETSKSSSSANKQDKSSNGKPSVDPWQKWRES